MHVDKVNTSTSGLWQYWNQNPETIWSTVMCLPLEVNVTPKEKKISIVHTGDKNCDQHTWLFIIILSGSPNQNIAKMFTYPMSHFAIVNLLQFHWNKHDDSEWTVNISIVYDESCPSHDCIIHFKSWCCQWNNANIKMTYSIQLEIRSKNVTKFRTIRITCERVKIWFNFSWPGKVCMNKMYFLNRCRNEHKQLSPWFVTFWYAYIILCFLCM